MTEGRTDRTRVNCKILRETEKAWLIDDGSREVWIPKSQSEAYSLADGTTDLFVEKWIAKDKGLI